MKISSLLSRVASIVTGGYLDVCSDYGLSPAALATAMSAGFPVWLYQLGSGKMGTIWPDEKPVMRETPLGMIRGVSHEDINIFRGIRYALPPTGERRLAPPVTSSGWDGTYDATRYGYLVSQPGTGDIDDGLSLNIWTPWKGGEERFPVFVFVHGGAFLFGGGGLHIYEGSPLAKAGIVVVTLNYRLNTPGFLPLQTTFSEYGTTGNWALMDIICALTWIRENISSFGGDAGCVTLAGQSAGAFAVSALISSPMARELFHQAVLMSGGMGSLQAAAPKTSKDLSRNIDLARRSLAKLGLADDKKGLSRLRELPASKILDIQPEVEGVMAPQAKNFWPVEDGYVVPFQLLKTIRSKTLNRVKLMFGSTTDEVGFFISPATTSGDYEKLTRNAFGKYAKEILSRYPIKRGYSAKRRCIELANAAGIRAGMFPYADALSSMGEDVYAYRFDALDPLLKGSSAGIPHASDIKFVFRCYMDEINADSSASADAKDIYNALTNFIKNGDPNTGAPISARWERYLTENPRELKIGRGAKMEPIYQGEEIKLVNEIFRETE